jgi:hypothetical protein
LCEESGATGLEGVDAEGLEVEAIGMTAGAGVAAAGAGVVGGAEGVTAAGAGDWAATGAGAMTMVGVLCKRRVATVVAMTISVAMARP